MRFHQSARWWLRIVLEYFIYGMRNAIDTATKLCLTSINRWKERVYPLRLGLHPFPI